MMPFALWCRLMRHRQRHGQRFEKDAANPRIVHAVCNRCGRKSDGWDFTTATGARTRFEGDPTRFHLRPRFRLVRRVR